MCCTHGELRRHVPFFRRALASRCPSHQEFRTPSLLVQLLEVGPGTEKACRLSKEGGLWGAPLQSSLPSCLVWREPVPFLYKMRVLVQKESAAPLWGGVTSMLHWLATVFAVHLLLGVFTFGAR